MTAEEKLRQEIKHIVPADRKSMEKAEKRWKSVGKPLFSLGKLEDAVIQIAGIKEKAVYSLDRKGLVIMCADNGVVAEGVTQTGQEVTAIVAENFTKKETSVCLMAEVAGVDLFPVDIGMVTDVPEVTKPEYKVAYGTEDMMRGPAMTREQAAQAVLNGIRIVRELAGQGYDILATGEMGIGNTTTSSAVVSVLLDQDAEAVTGRGAGLSSEGIRRKIEVIRESVRLNRAGPGGSAGRPLQGGRPGYCGTDRGIPWRRSLPHSCYDRWIYLVGCRTLRGPHGPGVRGLHAGVPQIRGDGRGNGAGCAGALPVP